MKFILCLLMIIISSGFASSDAFAETWYYYVEPLPNYASYATNVMDLSTTAWEDANDDLEFIEVTSPEQANFQVQWVKEFGVEHVGYAYGSWFIEVGLGDSNCGTGMWQPYSEKYTTHIMTHEIGHVLGWDHVDDPDSIMYPVALNWEYGIVETSKTLTNDYGYFSPICTSKDSATFNWQVSSDDPTYGFDVYFVPSIEEFDSWVEDGTFSYFDDAGCFAENMISVGGTCEGVTSESGLLVLMGDKATEPLTEITLNVQEINLSNNFSLGSNESVKSTPLPDPTVPVAVDTEFELYVDPLQQFSIKYPSNWIVDSTDYGIQKVNFINDYDWTAQIYVTDYGDVDYTGFNESEILDDIISYEQEYCNDASIIDSGYICYEFQPLGSDPIVMASGEEAYIVGYQSTRQYDSISRIEYPITTILTEIHDGSNVWVVYSEVDTYAIESYGEILVQSLESFKIIQSGEESSTPKSSGTPIPTPQPEVITSTGSATLSKSSVEIGFDQSEEVKIYGTINNVNKSTRINITYTYPDGTTNGVQVFSTDSGVYETILDLDVNSPKGVYEILVTSKGKILGMLELEVVEKKMDSQQFPKVITTDTEQTPIESPTILEKPKFSFVDDSKDPWSYVDRYNNEASYKEWFDENYPDYTIYEAVNLKTPLDFIDTSKDPQFYVDRYNNEASYKEWFDENYPDYTIYEGIGITEDEYLVIVASLDQPDEESIETQDIGESIVADNVDLPVVTTSQKNTEEIEIETVIQNDEPTCGAGTVAKNGICVVDTTKSESSSKGGGCLIATATYGSEMAPQVQQLRELRDNSLLSTESGINFINSFNDVYYSFSPVIADYERENPIFKEIVKIAITPMITSLSILNYVDMDSEESVLGYGISLIMLNVMMYVGIPILAVMRFRR